MDAPIIVQFLTGSPALTADTLRPYLLLAGLGVLGLVTFAAVQRRLGVYAWYLLGLVLPPLLFSELYYFAFLLGGATALAEVIGKFSDEPIKALGTTHAVAYLLFNGLIAAFALHVLIIYKMPVDAAQDKLKLVIAAGVGSMLIMRSKLFNIKVAGEDVAFGPDQIIKVFFRFMEAEIDRVRAQTRIDFVKRLMTEIDFDRVRNYSQTMLQAAQALDDKARQACTDAIKKIVDMPYAVEERQLKSYELGFVLLNTMGENFLIKLFDNAPPEWKVRAPIRDAPAPGLLDRLLPPKDERVFYFAYGQSICSFEFRKRMGWSAMDETMFAQQVAPRTAMLANYRLDFSAPDRENKGVGLPTILPQPGENVEGVVYRLSAEQLGYLDTEQPGYQRFHTTALVDGKEVAVITYRAGQSVAGLQPAAAYLQCMIDGAKEHQLSERYLNLLSSIVPKPYGDPAVPAVGETAALLSVVQ